MRYLSKLASRNSEQLERLALELATLSREDRAKVLADAAHLSVPRAPAKFSIPKLAGGSGWVGGELRREHLYGEDGR
jgi:hypothetical protein